MRGIAICKGAGKSGCGLLLLGVDDVELALCGVQRRMGPLIGGERLLVVGVRLLETLQRAELVVRQAAIAIDIVFGTGDFGCGRRQLSLGLGDHCLLQATGRVEIGERGLLPGDAGDRLRQRGAIVAVVEPDQKIAGMDLLVVGDRDISDESRHLRRDHGDVPADIGVVGALDETPDGPPVMAVPGSAKPCQQRGARDAKLPA